jgi:hypothetical protein
MNYFTQVVTRVMMIGIGFGIGWILSEVFALLGASPTRQWWAFWVPAMMVGAFAVSGFVTDVLSLPRPLVYLGLLAAGFYGLAQEPESLQRHSPTEPTTVTGDTAARFHFVASLNGQSMIVRDLPDEGACERARAVYRREGLTVGKCERGN